MASVGKVEIPVEVLAAGEWSDKCWGRTRCLISRPHYQLHELEVEQGQCSVHYHQRRANRFIVQSGTIAVIEYFWKNEAIHILNEGDERDVPSWVVHQFRVIVPGRILEEYWADRGDTIHTDDIERLQVGSEIADLSDHEKHLQEEAKVNRDLLLPGYDPPQRGFGE